MLNDTCDLWEDHKRSRCMNHVAMVAKLSSSINRVVVA